MTELEDHGLPLTALAVAAGRAVETSRTDLLSVDPFAAALVEPPAHTWTPVELLESAGWRCSEHGPGAVFNVRAQPVPH